MIADPVRTISASIVGAEVGPFTRTVDARWLMAYAACLGETDPRFYDTCAATGPLAHPLFPVCYEWPVALAIRDAVIDRALAPLGVHATHHLVLHRAPRAGDTLLTTARVIGVSRRRAGTLVVTRFATLDDRGAAVTTTDYGSIYRGVACDGEEHVVSADVGAWTSRHPRHVDPPRQPASDAGARPAWTDAIDVTAGTAHVYTECARIWNPIHTDIAAARAAGLPGLILHGTATLALAISRVVARELDGDPRHVRELGARFTGMVPMPSHLAMQSRRPGPDRIEFELRATDATPVLSDGWLRS
jgi:acyl dehydratase